MGGDVLKKTKNVYVLNGQIICKLYARNIPRRDKGNNVQNFYCIYLEHTLDDKPKILQHNQSF